MLIIFPSCICACWCYKWCSALISCGTCMWFTLDGWCPSHPSFKNKFLELWEEKVNIIILFCADKSTLPKHILHKPQQLGTGLMILTTHATSIEAQKTIQTTQTPAFELLTCGLLTHEKMFRLNSNTTRTFLS